MKRSTRAELARETVGIVERGDYTTATNRVVNIAGEVRACLDATRYYSPEELEPLRTGVLARPGRGLPTALEVVNETTLSGIARILEQGLGPVAALNFASARNPGGGFLNGSEAQEESLARSSALYASQVRAWTFYERHREASSLLYSDAIILSPGCPIIRNETGELLDEPRQAAFLTCAAPNAGALANRPAPERPLAEVLLQRSEMILAVAASQGYRHLVLGAWGCGVFRNDPAIVAGAFATHLLAGRWADRFDRVVFSVLDPSPNQATIGPFKRALG